MRIKVEKVSYSPSRVNIYGLSQIDQLSFELEGAGITGIIGGKDSGKKTLVFLLSALLCPDKGHIFFNEEDINVRNRRQAPVRNPSVFVMSDGEMALHEKTVERELRHALRDCELERDEEERLIRSGLGMMGLEYDEIAHIAPAALSRSLRYKIILVSAYLAKPEVLLLDEPFARLDACGCRQFKELLTSLTEAGCRVIIADNNVDFFAEYADSVIVMHRGQLIRSGSPKQVFNDYYDLIRNHIPVPQVKKTSQKLWEHGINMPLNVVEYEQLVDRLKIIMWRKGK